MNNIDKNRKALAAALRAKRKEKGLSTVSLATTLGLPRPRVSELESARISHINTYIAAAQALGGEIIIKWKD